MHLGDFQIARSRRAGIVILSRRKIAVGLRRSSRTAARRKSMWGRANILLDTADGRGTTEIMQRSGETTHWTAEAASLSLRSVQRILEAHQLAPHQIRTFKLSKAPKFAEKLQDIVGTYVDPLAHAVVISVDEWSQIQALDRPQYAVHK
jgi:hypothetical protein